MIPAIITNGLSRKILVEAEAEFFSPSYALRELWETKDSWYRSDLAVSALDHIFDALFARVSIVDLEEYVSSVKEAYDIMKQIDEKDTPFLALALHLNCPIWSNDKHLKRQKESKAYSTVELARILGIK